MINRIISKCISWRYAATEPRALRLQRQRFQHYYWGNIPQHVFIITPTYNRSKLLIERAWESIRKQTYTNWTWVVVGDMCTDSTAEIMTLLQAESDRVFFWNLPRYKKHHPQTPEGRWFCGPVYALNTALDFIQPTNWQWIANIDDDDLWEPCHLEHALRYAVANNLEFVSAYNMEEREGVESIIKDDPATPGIGARATWVYRSYLSFMRYNVNCYRKAWNRVNDTDLAERMIKAGVRIGMLPEVHAYTVPRPNETQIGLKAYKEAEEKHYHVHG